MAIKRDSKHQKKKIKIKKHWKKIPKKEKICNIFFYFSIDLKKAKLHFGLFSRGEGGRGVGTKRRLRGFYRVFSSSLFNR